MSNELIKKKNIYDVNEVLENALVYGVDEYGEILSEEQIGELVEKMEMTLSSKLEYMGKVIINSDTFAKAIDSEIKRLQEKKKMVENGASRTKTYIDKFIRYKYTDMETGELDEKGLREFKLKSPSINLSYLPSAKLQVIDITKVPKKYVKTTVEEKVDAIPLKKFMKDSGLVETEYAKVVTNINLQIK